MRCTICDYVEGIGSDYLGIPPRSSIRVLNHKIHGPTCTVCLDEIQGALNDYNQDQDQEDADEDASTLS
jgi:hypothetical protein